MKRYFSVKVFCVCSLLVLLLPCRAASVVLEHKEGQSGRPLTEEGWQSVHEFTQDVYLTKNQSITLTPPAATSRYAYRRWFDYADERASISGLKVDGMETDKGIVVIGSQTLPTYTFSGSACVIACDQSNYTDYTASGTTLREATLAQRVLFNIRPAAEMAAQVDACTGETYLEEYQLTAPVGRTLYIGPKYQFNGGNYPNYYYKSSSPASLASATWQWNGGTLPAVMDNHYVKVSGTTAGTQTYTLQASVRTGGSWWTPTYTSYNIAKFTITFTDAKECGPIAAPSNAEELAGMDILYEERFNFVPSNTTEPTYYSTPLQWDEASYGFYYRELGSQRAVFDKHVPEGDPYWSDYAFISSSNALNAAYFVQNVYNHGATGTSADAKEGYFFYVDGAQEPGQCFSLRVDADLCAGSTMWFSAYMVALNKANASPQLDFAVSGVREDGSVEPISTFVTGEIVTTATPAGSWQRIVFPLQLDKANQYKSYRLVITNKGNGSNGNDFALDDIQIFASKPPVVPLQASGPVCIDPEGDQITTYLRVAYEEANMQGGRIFYQWADENGKTIDMPYYNKATANGDVYGSVEIPKGTPNSKVYTSLAAFDAYASESDVASAMGFVKENGSWVLYIATQGELLAEHTYTGYVATDAAELRSAQCGMFTELRVQGSMYMAINGVRILSGEQVRLCGNHLLVFSVERLIIGSDATGMTERRASCSADWLWGTEAYVNEHSDGYGADFATIKAAISASHDGSATEAQTALLARLESQGLLQRNRATIENYLAADFDKRQLLYTAFPIENTGRLLDDKGEMMATAVEVCPEPVEGEADIVRADDNIIRIGYAEENQMTDMLPNFVSASPRVVRISEAQRRSGTMKVPVYYNRESKRTFYFAGALLYGTTDPAFAIDDVVLPLSNPQVDETVTEITLTGLEQLHEGYEYVFVLRESSSVTDDCQEGEVFFRLITVPDRVVWSPAGESSAWNNDVNWRTPDGKQAWCPTPETDVVLPQGGCEVPRPVSAAYQRTDTPLEDGAGLYISYDINYTPYACRNLYLPSGTALLNQHLLRLGGKAVVDMEVPVNQWVLCAMPVTGGVSGDFWTPASGEDSSNPFAVKAIGQSEGSAANDRTANPVWQSLYNKSLKNKGNTEDIVIESSTWTEPLNALATSYTAGMGVALWVESGSGAESVTFRLPKQDTEYWYYSENSGLWRSDLKETVSRGAGAGSPAYAYDSRLGGMEITLSNYDASGDMFLFGNPTFAYIDMSLLQSANSELNPAYYVWTEGSQELVANVGTLTTDGSSHVLLAPMRGMLLQRASAGATLNVRITPNMLTIDEEGARKAPRRAATAERRWHENALYVSATADDFTSRAVVHVSLTASDRYEREEDASLVLLDEWKTPFGIYTLSDDHTALSINSRCSSAMIPLACYSQHNIGNMSVRFDGEPDFVEEWDLYDSATGVRTALHAGETLSLPLPTDGSVRYYLDKRSGNGTTTAVSDKAQGPSVWATGAEGVLYVHSEADMETLTVTDMLGRIVGRRANAGREAAVALPQGVYVVDVLVEDVRKTLSVLVR